MYRVGVRHAALSQMWAHRENLSAIALLPVNVRGEAEMTLEDLRQVALVGKTARAGNVRERHIRLVKQQLSVLDSLAQHDLMQAGPCRFAEQTGKVI